MSRFTQYRAALNALSTRTGTPLPSLIVSFGILHELTAIVPLVGIFYAARVSGVGENVVRWVQSNAGDGTGDNINGDGSVGVDGWIRLKGREWVKDGEEWAGRVGRRYGVFGFEKGGEGREGVAGSGYSADRLAGDVANAVFAYGMTKALLPLRIGLSLYLSPAFSRGVVEPVRRAVVRPFMSRKSR